jgi:S1-C subfamily serine protease
MGGTMKKGFIISLVIVLLSLSTAGLALLHFQNESALNQTKAQVGTLNGTISGLETAMATMRNLSSGVATGSGESIAQLAGQVSPAVVRIDVSGPGFAGVGSGFIVDESGYVLTNQHVIENSTSVKVTLTSGDFYNATVVSFDANRDLALLKMISTVTNFPTITLGSASDATVGDTLVLVGYPLGLELTGPPSFSNGIVSAIRTIQGLSYIQTNATMNPGNSGGPAVDMQGDLVGMSVAQVTDPNINVVGLGLVIPVADVLKFIDNGTVPCSSCHYKS